VAVALTKRPPREFRELSPYGSGMGILKWLQLERYLKDGSHNRLFLHEDPPLMLRFAFHVLVLFAVMIGAAVGSSQSLVAQDEITNEVVSVDTANAYYSAGIPRIFAR
jgi:hypothetical protein